MTFYFARLGKDITREEEADIVSKLIGQTDLIYSIFENDRYVGQIGLSEIYWPAQTGARRHALSLGVGTRHRP